MLIDNPLESMSNNNEEILVDCEEISKATQAK
jgi:hypothetical protein